MTSPSMVVCHLSTVHTHNDIRIFRKECSTLAAAGFTVKFVVPVAEGAAIEPSDVEIVALQRPTSRAIRFTRTWIHLLRRALAADAKIYHFHDPELMVVGIILKALGKTVVYDVHEDIAGQVHNKHWIPDALKAVTSKSVDTFERLVAGWFDAIVVATPKLKERFTNPKTVVVQNFPIAEELFEPTNVAYEDREKIATYIGGITEIRGALEMVDAIGLLSESHGAALELAGPFFPANLEQRLRARPAWPQVRYLGVQSREGVKAALARARVGLVLFHPAPNHLESQPNKLFEYMSAGLPLIGSDFPLWRSIVSDNDCGLLVDPQDAEAIAKAIQWIFEHPLEAEEMGRNGKKAVLEKYRWEVESKTLLDLYEHLSK